MAAPTNTPEKVIREFLVNDADVAARVGTKIRPQQADQADGLPPFLVYTRAGGDKTHHLLASSGLATTTIRLRGFETTANGQQIFREECRLALDGRRPGEVTISGNALDVRSIRMTSERDEFQDPTDDSDDGIYGFSQDYDVVHKELIPTF